MKVETLIFGGVAAFLFISAIIYGVFSHEAVGIVGLVLAGGFCLILSSYFGFIVRRIELRPEDRGDADISEGAGELGFFSPSSYWPLGVGLSVMVLAIGAAYWNGWLMGVGGVLLLLAAAGLVFEYYVGQLHRG